MSGPSSSPANEQPRSIIAVLWKSSSWVTLTRVITSRHTADLAFLIASSISIVLVSSATALLYNLAREYVLKNEGQTLSFLNALFSAIDDSGIFIGAVGGIGCGVIAWAYQAGNLRLGVVDLFAGEIVTLCRVCAITDVVVRYTNLYDRPEIKFTNVPPEENYMIVYDINAEELKALDRDTVTDVAAFYTYMKASRDVMRNLIDIQSHQDPVGKKERWNYAIRNLIFMLFLAFDSGRSAVMSLVEDKRDQIANTLTVLLSEIAAYHFLLSLKEISEEDFRRKRLELRFEELNQVVWDSWDAGREFAKPRETAIEVMNRWTAAFPDSDSAQKFARMATSA
jgi:hypothetical protein